MRGNLDALTRNKPTTKHVDIEEKRIIDDKKRCTNEDFLFRRVGSQFMGKRPTSNSHSTGKLSFLYCGQDKLIFCLAQNGDKLSTLCILLRDNNRCARSVFVKSKRRCAWFFWVLLFFKFFFFLYYWVGL